VLGRLDRLRLKGNRLVWLVVEPSQPGAAPTGAFVPGQSDADKTAVSAYYVNFGLQTTVAMRW
jgi:hypothetical protein